MSPLKSLTILLAIFATFEFSEPKDYCDVCRDHVMCKYTRKNQEGKCGELLRGEMSENEKRKMMDAHNAKRQYVARGEQEGQPGASDMQNLEWDSELETIAQRNADQCKFEHDSCRNKLDGEYFGQNIFGSSFSLEFDQARLESTIDGAVNSWYNEVKSFPRQNIEPFQYVNDAGHYTQVVWSRTNRIGCGRSYYHNQNQNGEWWYNVYIVCNYAPGGNVGGPGSYLYKQT